MSISGVTEPEGTVSRSVPVSTNGQLDFGCSCGLGCFFDPGALPLLLLSRPLLLPRHDVCLYLCGSFEELCCCLSLSPRYSWRALKPLVPPKLATSLTLWLAREVDLTLVLELDVKELCLEVLRVLARSYTRVFARVWPDFL